VVAVVAVVVDVEVRADNGELVLSAAQRDLSLVISVAFGEPVVTNWKVRKGPMYDEVKNTLYCYSPVH